MDKLNMLSMYTFLNLFRLKVSNSMSYHPCGFELSFGLISSCGWSGYFSNAFSVLSHTMLEPAANV